MISNLERYIPLFENYIRAQDKAAFAKEINDPIERELLACLVSDNDDF
jgi:hypothetical protein